MSTVNTLIFGVLLYIILCLIGHAVIALFRLKADPLEVFALSPVIGLAFLTLLTTYLALLNIPFELVSKTIMLIIAILSTIYLVIIFRNDFKRGVLVRLKYLIPFLATFCLIALPFLIGGYQYAILRGNGTDAFNYVSMADAFSRFPMEWIMTQPESILREQSPNLVFAQEMFTSRWSTSALLAFNSSAFGISPIEFEYVFTLIMIVVFLSALIAALSAIGVLNSLTVWLPVAFIVGFWGQFILDIRAFSQIVSLPILVVLVGWLLSIKNSHGPVFRYGVGLTAILTVSLFFQYPEIVVAFLPGTLLLFLIHLWGRYIKKILTRKDFGRLIIFLIFIILLLTPLIDLLFRFALEQTQFAVTQSLGWEKAYFTWMKNPISGIWGVGINTGYMEFLDGIFTVLTFIIALALTLGVIVRFITILLSRKQLKENMAEASLFLLCISGFLGAVILFAHGNAWAAGKVLSYFAFLIPIWMAINLSNKHLGESRPRLIQVSSIILILAILVWGSINVIYAGARITHAITESDFPGYMTNHGEYRRVNAGAIAKMPDINLPEGSTVTIFEPSTWGREFLAYYIEGNGYSALTPGFSGSRIIKPDLNETNNEIEYVLANSRFFASSNLTTPEDNTYNLIPTKPGNHFAAVVAFEGGYGMETYLGTSLRYIWTGEQDIWITLFATSINYNVSLRLCPGEVRDSNDSLVVLVEVDGKQISQLEVTECMDLDVELLGDSEKKFIQIRIASSDLHHGPTILGQDTRDLRLRVELSQIRLKDSIH